MLPLKQAIKLPFDFYYKVRLEDLSGKIILQSDNIHRAMIKIGGRNSEMFPHNPVIISISRKAKIIFTGITEIGCGCLLRVDNEGTLKFGKNVRIGAKTKLFCEDSILFGNEIRISWECQIFDTSFHFIQNTLNKDIFPKTAPIEIGSYNWFGNRVNIMKGTITPNNTIIASNSLCNKNYSNIPPYSLLAGQPAKIVKTNIKRMFEGIDI